MYYYTWICKHFELYKVLIFRFDFEICTSKQLLGPTFYFYTTAYKVAEPSFLLQLIPYHEIGESIA
jgi:hypothetical protein